MTDPLDEHPRTVADPRAWIRFGLTHLTAAGGAYGIGLTLFMAVLVGSLEVPGTFGLLAIPTGIAIGAVLGLVLGTLDGFLVRSVGQDHLRLATTAFNVAVTIVVMVVIGTAAGASGLLVILVLYVGPAVVVAFVTWRRSPEARRIHG